VSRKLLAYVKERVDPFGEICYLTYAGSLTYGTNHEKSDIDIQGLFIPKLEYILGMDTVRNVDVSLTNGKGNKIEGTVFEIRNGFKQLVNANPNRIEMLWVRDQDIIFKNDVGERILKNRNIFMSKKLKHSFSGYANGQYDRLNRLDKKKSTNPDRIELMDKFGFDTKKGAHLIRLLNTAIEALVEGEIYVFRDDREFLKSIIRGKYTMSEVQQMADERFKLLERAYVSSSVPRAVDHSAINILLTNILLSRISQYIEGNL